MKGHKSSKYCQRSLWMPPFGKYLYILCYSFESWEQIYRIWHLYDELMSDELLDSVYDSDFLFWWHRKLFLNNAYLTFIFWYTRKRCTSRSCSRLRYLVPFVFDFLKSVFDKYPRTPFCSNLLRGRHFQKSPDLFLDLLEIVFFRIFFV